MSLSVRTSLESQKIVSTADLLDGMEEWNELFYVQFPMQTLTKIAVRDVASLRAFRTDLDLRPVSGTCACCATQLLPGFVVCRQVRA
jgi:hypothetical protein